MTGGRRTCRNPAFSLVETALAAVLMGVVLLPLLGMMSEGTRLSRSSLDEVLGASFAADVLEQIAAAGADGLLPEATLSTRAGTLVDGAPVPGSRWARFHLAPVPHGLEATLSLSSPRGGIRRAEVLVTRTRTRAGPVDRSAIPLSIRMVTLVEASEP